MSKSGGGALFFDADAHFDPNQDTSITGVLTSPLIPSPGAASGKIYLQFYQYCRFHKSKTRIEILDSGSNPIAEFQVNPNLGVNQETSNKDVLAIEITGFMPSEFEEFKVRFTFEGNYYFWIIDDIRIVQDIPVQICDTLWGNVKGQGDFNEGLNGWTTFNPDTCTAVFVWEPDGKADDGVDIDGNGALGILSPTIGNGAAVFDADYYDSGGIEFGMGPCPGYQGAYLISPTIDLSEAKGPLFLKFNQYYSNLASATWVGYSSNGGNDWSWIPVNTGLGHDITERDDVQVIHLAGATGSSQFQVGFYIHAYYYFWIVDDVQVLEGIFQNKKTFPAYVADSLLTFQLPFDVGCDSAAFVKNQIVVHFASDASESYKDSLRQEFGVVSFKKCQCKEAIEEWEMGLPPFNPAAAPGGSGTSTDINGQAATTSARPKVQGADVNKYNWNELKEAAGILFEPLLQAPVYIPDVNDDNAIVIAVPDTGIDYAHDSLQYRIWKTPNPIIGTSGLENDFIGWNFPDSTNNPNDNHGHGTHIAGIIHNNLKKLTQSSGDFRIMPLKTHDEHGVSDLFEVTCSMYYALQQGAKVINCSWGWVGDSSEVLSNVIDSARLNYNAVIVASAGNDTLDLNKNRQYPVCYASGNVLGVGALTAGENQISAYSNRSPQYLEISARGDQVISTAPNIFESDGFAEKSGSSMSAPAVAAAVAIAYNWLKPESSYLEIIRKVLSCAQERESLSEYVANGRVLNISPCLQVGVADPSEKVLHIELFPNPVGAEVNLLMKGERGENGWIMVSNTLGQTVKRTPFLFPGGAADFQIGMEGLFPGFYWVSIKAGQYIWSRKIIKI